MCSQFFIVTSIYDLEKLFGIKLTGENFQFELVSPYVPAPVMTASGLKLMQYSLIPSWSKEARLKFSTHNARIETIETKATWKQPFIKHHCLVPIQGFIEPIYRGEYAGHMVRFQASSPLIAAGIFDQWQNKKNGTNLESFAIITTEPSEFIKKSGHDRQPVFVDPPRSRLWLDTAEKFPDKLKALLQEISVAPQVQVEIVRKLKPGWEKRIKQK